jgi:hypothetical protein
MWLFVKYANNDKNKLLKNLIKLLTGVWGCGIIKASQGSWIKEI